LSRFGLYSVALLVLMADQASKSWIVAVHWHWPEEGRELIPGFFALTFNVNTGGAFGILPHGTLLLALAAAIAAVAIVVYSVRAPMPLPRLLGFALALAVPWATCWTASACTTSLIFSRCMPGRTGSGSSRSSTSPTRRSASESAFWRFTMAVNPRLPTRRSSA